MMIERRENLLVLRVPAVIHPFDRDAGFLEQVYIEISSRARSGQILAGTNLFAQAQEPAVSVAGKRILSIE
jgi:hypothetical protein